MSYSRKRKLSSRGDGYYPLDNYLNQKEKQDDEFQRQFEASVRVEQEPTEEGESSLIAQVADQFNFLLGCHVGLPVESEVLEQDFGLLDLVSKT